MPNYIAKTTTNPNVDMGTTKKLGVGTTSPSAQLHVKGAGGGTTPLIRVQSNEGTNSFVEFRGNGSGTEYFAGRIDVSNSDAFSIGRVGAAYDMYIKNNGNVGIGHNTNPQEKLDVKGNAMVRGYITFEPVVADAVPPNSLFLDISDYKLVFKDRNRRTHELT